MSSLPSQVVFLLPLMLLATGCTTIRPQGRSPLAPARMSSQSIVLEVFFVRCPFGDPRIDDTLWSEVDEQQLPTDLRWQLTRNGFRVGLVVGQIPVTLSQLLEITDAPPPADPREQAGPVDLQAESQPVRRHMQVRLGQRSEIITSGTYDELPVLVCQSGQLCGETYRQAQGLLALKVFNERDGRVRMELTPELHYGEPRQRWVAGQGTFRLEAGRAKRVFDALTLSATLSPGQMLVMTSLSNRSGSLGHYFFTDTQSGRLEQKLLVVRLAQTQHDDLLTPVDAPLEVEEAGGR